MTELNKGDIVICGSLIGIVVDSDEKSITLNTTVGQRTVNSTSFAARVCKGSEVVTLFTEQIRKKVQATR